MPDCGATPEQIHQIGLETAKAFDGFEVVVTTHIDRDHWHNHFVVNSVNCETGYKIQINEKGLEQLRQTVRCNLPTIRFADTATVSKTKTTVYKSAGVQSRAPR